MLPEDCFLRKIPHCLALEERLALQCVSSSIDTIYMCYENARELLLQYDQETIAQLPHRGRLGLFSDMWVIVDHTHMLTSLMRSSFHRIRGAIEFAEKYAAATRMRNDMDHIHSNIGNLSRMKIRRPALYGAFAYSILKFAPPTDEEEGHQSVTGCYHIAFNGGALTHQSHDIFEYKNVPRQIEVPIGDFEFRAFDDTLNVSQLKCDLDTLVDQSFGEKMRGQVVEAIRAAAVEHGQDPEILIQQAGSGALFLIAEIKFGDIGPRSS